MKVVELDPEYPETWLVRPAVESLLEGGIVILPTDSIYAVACDPWDRQAVARLYQAKRMDKSKRCSVMCGDLKAIGEVARAGDGRDERDAHEFRVLLDYRRHRP